MTSRFILLLLFAIVLTVPSLGMTTSAGISGAADSEVALDAVIRHQADSIADERINLTASYIKEAEAMVTKTKLKGNGAYILQKGSSFIYYSPKSRNT